MVFAHKPIAQAAELNDTVECARHALALLVCDVEFLIRDQKLGAGRLAGTNLCVGMVAFAGKSEAILNDNNNNNKMSNTQQKDLSVGHFMLNYYLVSKLPNTFQR